MKIIAKSCKGKEFLYNAKSARKVSEKSAEKILNVLNSVKWDLKDDEIWHIHDVDEYDSAFWYAERQSFTIRKGIVTARTC